MKTVADIFMFLAENADLIDELIDLIRSGFSKESIKASLRALKLKVSDQAMKEELGL